MQQPYIRTYIYKNFLFILIKIALMTSCGFLLKASTSSLWTYHVHLFIMDSYSSIKSSTWCQFWFWSSHHIFNAQCYIYIYIYHFSLMSKGILIRNIYIYELSFISFIHSFIALTGIISIWEISLLSALYHFFISLYHFFISSLSVLIWSTDKAIIWVIGIILLGAAIKEEELTEITNYHQGNISPK